MSTKRLSPEDWIDAALAALAEAGLGAVAVEPLAKRLGVTKGSFYWHFRDREALLAAALDHWERERTEGLIERLDRIDDPRARLALWARHALPADKSLLVALHAASDDPLVGSALARVTKRRVDWLAATLRDAGVPAAAARRRARLLYSADLGLFQVARALDGSFSAAELRALARDLEDAFLPDPSAG